MHRKTTYKKFGQTLRQDKHNTTTQPLSDFSRAIAKIWSSFTRQAYSLQHRYSQAAVELEPKFGRFLQNKPNILQHNHHSQTSVELEPKFGQILQDKPNTTAQPLPDFSMVQPKFGQILQDKHTYYNKDNPTIYYH